MEGAAMAALNSALGWTLFTAFGLLPSAGLIGADQHDAFAEPQPRSDSFCGKRRAVRTMPALREMVRRTDPQVQSGGKVIKGMYYAMAAEGHNDLVAFRLACHGQLEPWPFLVFDFRTGEYFLDADRDGCADEAGHQPELEVDPVDFLHRIDDAARYCYEDRTPT